MNRNSTTGRRIVHPVGKVAKPDEPIKTTWQTPENIVPQQVKYRLCKAGPKKCAECRLCAFGRWYVENETEEGNKK